jgi:hypothetical protein
VRVFVDGMNVDHIVSPYSLPGIYPAFYCSSCKYICHTLCAKKTVFSDETDVLAEQLQTMRDSGASDAADTLVTDRLTEVLGTISEGMVSGICQAQCSAGFIKQTMFNALQAHPTWDETMVRRSRSRSRGH